MENTSKSSTAYILTKDRVRPFLRKLAKGKTLIAPIALSNGDVALGKTNTVGDIILDYGQPVNSVKDFLFPQNEMLFSYNGLSHEELQEKISSDQTVFFGLRPCDIHAVAQADRFFTDSFTDIYYCHKRENSLFIAIACNEPEKSCFCSSTNSGPFLNGIADLQFIDLGLSYLVEAFTPQGEDVLKTYAMFFESASEKDFEEKYFLAASAESKMTHLNLVGIETAMQKTEDLFWETLGERCFSCGGCSFTCPLCFCYNVVDRFSQHDQQGTRWRTWDSCVFEGFTRMAGGHNLIKYKRERVRKRFFHKLVMYIQRYNHVGCVGCGRCTTTCLGGIDMAKVITALQEEVK